MNSFEILRRQIVVLAVSSGFPPMWDVPWTLCKCADGSG